jgi:hypothetical protein
MSLMNLSNPNVKTWKLGPVTVLQEFALYAVPMGGLSCTYNVLCTAIGSPMFKISTKRRPSPISLRFTDSESPSVGYQFQVRDSNESKPYCNLNLPV